MGTGRWLGPFHRWGGHAYVRRWFRARQAAGGVDPSEQDSLDDVVASDSDKLEDYIQISDDDYRSTTQLKRSIGVV